MATSNQPTSNSSRRQNSETLTDSNSNSNNNNATSTTMASLEERLSIRSPTDPTSSLERTSTAAAAAAGLQYRRRSSSDFTPLSPLQDFHYQHHGSLSTTSSSLHSHGHGNNGTNSHNTHSSSNNNNNNNNNGGFLALQSFTRVSRRAALATKEQFWDSNDAGIVAAQTAVDQWEQGYNALRGLLMAMGKSAKGIYGAAKAGANGLEHGLLLPVRDWILLPAFGGVEHLVGETVGFLQSDQTQILAQQSLSLARQVPFVGENVLVPAMCIGAEAIKRTWEIAQYPIPAPHQVRDSVDSVLTGTKWALTTAGREVFLYVKRADANITRTLSHTQWKVLGSGPYATLDKLSKREIIDHFCERYFSTIDPVARYELAAHVRAHNRPLYHDLVITGLLRERGGTLTVDDEWLSVRPRYRNEESNFLLHEDFTKEEDVFALWFRLPYQNGKRPKRDTPWVPFDRKEREKLESKYRSVLQEHQGQVTMTSNNNYTNGSDQPVVINSDNGTDSSESTDTISQEQLQYRNGINWGSPKYATNAKWYDPNLEADLLLDQKRHAVTFFPCCPKCRKRHETRPPLVPKQFEELCDDCTAQHSDAPWVDALLSLPPLDGVYRPTLWRFYGPGDEIRRATWFLDTKRNGPQPYGEDAQAVLEDAYLFLKWISRRRVLDGSVLLTVQVSSPDGSEHQLVQFSSLTSATAIGKGLGGAISLFKRRVYRGACYRTPTKASSVKQEEEKNPVPVASDLEQLKLTSSIEDAELEKSNLKDSSEDAADEETPNEEDVGACPDVSLENGEVCEQEQLDDVPLPPDDMQVLAKSDFHMNERPSLAYQMKTKAEKSANDLDKSTAVDDDDVDHLVLIIHGVGEMMQTFDLFGLKKVPTLVDCCGYLRDNHAEVLDIRFSQMFEATDGLPEARFGRVEYLPVEWHESFSIQSTRRLLTESTPSSPPRYRPKETTINDISLRTIPNLRQFANDTLMDVLYFMSPAHHDMIIDIVVYELNFVVERFRKLTGFQGDISIAGHSLGSIIAWDILDHQKKCNHSPIIAMQPESTPPEQEDQQQQDQDTSYPQLDFEVDNAFMLGSPIPVFLMIRNQRKPLSIDYTLSGCPRVFNIFHPYDPVSYRIEPLLDPKNADIEPKIMTHWNGGFRFQYQTKILWQKLVDQTMHAQESVLNSLESGIVALGLLDSAYEDNDEEDGDDDMSQESSHRVITGQLNGGRRIDYMLQEKEIDRANEYVAALAAHSCYWLEKDLSLFIARQICLRALERAANEDSSMA